MPVILPLTYYLFTPRIQEILRNKKADYLFSRQEPKFFIDIFQTSDGFVEVYIHKSGYCHSLSHQKLTKAG